MSQRRIPVGIQLYSLRDVIGADVPGTLKQLAKMGYETVEFAGNYDLPAKTLRAMLDDTGLKCASAHVSLDAVADDALAATVDFYKVLGTELLIVPWADMGELDHVIARLKAAHARALTLGARLGFHNHTGEFNLSADGVTHFDRIFAELPEDFVVQLDIGWAKAAGQDVPALLRKYAKRTETVHVKEFNPADGAAVVGEGSVDWPAIMDIIETETAVKWYIVEQEQYKVGPMESARGCIENIRKMGR
jgi:sugar phosphate isomerase/epimerase